MKSYLTALLLIQSLTTQAVDPPLKEKLISDGYDEDDWTIHDPSRIVVLNGSKHMIAATGKAQEGGYDCGIETWWREENGSGNWRPGQCLFTVKPDWISEIAPKQDGAYWAPELVSKSALLYSFSEGFNEDGPVTCVGVATSTGDLNQMTWTDVGKPMFCIDQKDYDEERSAIDPSIFTGFDGKTYLVTGGGYIIGTELDNTTYMPQSNTWFSPNDPAWYQLARGPFLTDDQAYDWVEAAYIWPRTVNSVAYYFLFVNWGSCCSGVKSSYRIRVGRSTNPMGPFVDKNGKDLMNGGGSLLLKKTGYMIGPGHVGIYQQNSKEIMTFHYYDSRRGSGESWIAEREIYFQDDWPVAGKLLSSYGFCADDCSFKFNLDNFAMEMGCSWITKNKRKTRARKAKYCDRISIKNNCPATCDSNCANNPEFTFKLSIGSTVPCNWLTKNRNKSDIRRTRYCVRADVASSCTSACGRCNFS